IFNVPDRVGLSAVLSGRAGHEAALPVPAFGPLAVLPAGARPPNPQELLLRPALATFLELAHHEHDVILIDTPPARENADALIACSLIVVDFRIGVVLLILLMPISGSSTLFPHEMFGVVGLNPLNLLLVGTLFSCLLHAAADRSLPQFLPQPLLWLYIVPIVI